MHHKAAWEGAMSVPRLVSSWMLVVFFGCASDGIPGPATGLAHAAATVACGPADGPAVAIYLASAPVESLEPAAPYLRFYVWQSLERLSGRSWAVAGRESEGGAWLHSTATDYEIAIGGRVTVSSVAPDSTIEGSADVTFPSAGRIRVRFRAEWLSRAVLCG